MKGGGEQAYRKAIALSSQPYYAAYIDLGAPLCKLEARCEDVLQVFDEAVLLPRGLGPTFIVLSHSRN